MTMSAKKQSMQIIIIRWREIEIKVSPGKLENITTGGSGPTKNDPEDEDSEHALQFVCRLYVALETCRDSSG